MPPWFHIFSPSREEAVELRARASSPPPGPGGGCPKTSRVPEDPHPGPPPRAGEGSLQEGRFVARSRGATASERAGGRARSARGAELLLLLALAGCDSLPHQPDPPPPPEAPPADELEARLRARGAEIADWMMRNGDPMRGELAEGGARDFSQLMQPGWCYKIVAVSEGIEDLDLRLYDQGSVLVQRDTTQDAQPYIGLERPICPGEAGTYRIEVRARAGSGPFAVQVYRSL